MPSDLNLIKKKKKKAADGNQATRPVSRETRRKREREGRRGERRYCGRLMPGEESTDAVLEMNILEKSRNRNRKQGSQEPGKEETQCKMKLHPIVQYISIVSEGGKANQLFPHFFLGSVGPRMLWNPGRKVSEGHSQGCPYGSHVSWNWMHL